MSLRDQLDAVRSTQGELTPATVVKAAEPDDHPLHGRFEWNDTVAGHEYRKVQAAELIRSVRVSYGEPRQDGEKKSVRAFVPVRGTDRSSAYEPIEEVVQDEFARKLLLQECRREWESFKRKYGDLEEFAEIVNLQLTA